VKRRKFITLLGGAAAGWPLVAQAQVIPVIGWLSSRTLETDVSLLPAFRQGLGAAGYVENQNAAVEYRFADGQYDRLAALAADLVRRQVGVIVAVGARPATLAAKAATSSIPVVFNLGSDPVQLGVVASVNRPGGNLTGAWSFAGASTGKNLGLLHELVPKAAAIAVLSNPSARNPTQLRDAREATAALGLHLRVLEASTKRDRHGFRDSRRSAGRRDARHYRSVLSHQGRSDRRPGGPPCRTHNLRSAPVRGGGRLDQLRR
jgi:putative ABC transport system substrate-binding protein